MASAKEALEKGHGTNEKDVRTVGQILEALEAAEKESNAKAQSVINKGKSYVKKYGNKAMSMAADIAGSVLKSGGALTSVGLGTSDGSSLSLSNSNDILAANASRVAEAGNYVANTFGFDVKGKTSISAGDAGDTAGALTRNLNTAKTTTYVPPDSMLQMITKGIKVMPYTEEQFGNIDTYTQAIIYRDGLIDPNSKSAADLQNLVNNAFSFDANGNLSFDEQGFYNSFLTYGNQPPVKVMGSQYDDLGNDTYTDSDVPLTYDENQYEANDVQGVVYDDTEAIDDYEPLPDEPAEEPAASGPDIPVSDTPEQGAAPTVVYDHTNDADINAYLDKVASSTPDFDMMPGLR